MNCQATRPERAPRVAAVREAFEESGVVIGAEDSAASHAEMIETRKAIDAGTLPFLDFIREQKITIDIGRLTLFSRWRTPPISPKRFDTFFFLAPVPTDQIAIHDGHEAVESEWVAPQEALRLVEAGQRTIVFPTRMNLRLLSSSPTLADAVAAADRRERRGRLDIWRADHLAGRLACAGWRIGGRARQPDLGI